MTDYSKPIGWWCPECAKRPGEESPVLWCKDSNRPELFTNATRVRCVCGTWCTPVYAPIPESERPQTTWDEPEVVLAVSDCDGETRIANARDFGPFGDGCSSRRWAYSDASANIFRLMRPYASIGDVADIGDAIRWVVEGRRP